MSLLHHLTLKYRQDHQMNTYNDALNKFLYEYTLEYESTLGMVKPSRGYVQAISEDEAVRKLLEYYKDKIILESITVQRTDIILLED